MIRQLWKERFVAEVYLRERIKRRVAAKINRFRYWLIYKIAMGDGVIINCDVYEPYPKAKNGSPAMFWFNTIHTAANISGRGEEYYFTSPIMPLTQEGE